MAPTNANLAVEQQQLRVVLSQDGGTCQRAAVEAQLQQLQPSITQTSTVELPVTVLPPTINNQQATALKQTLERQLNQPLQIQTTGRPVALEAQQVLGWLRFDNTGQAIVVSLSDEASQPVLAQQVAAKVAVAAGVSQVTTHDFVETARTDGAPGRALDFAATRQSMVQYLMGQSSQIQAITKQIPPQITYKRSYSSTDAALSALIQQYAQERPGQLAVSFIELSGKRRWATYNGDQSVTSASTYKALLAFSVLKRINRCNCPGRML